MKESKLFKSLVATLVVIVLSGPTVVLASTSSHLETNEVTVSYADLNLENEEGVRVLYQRLKRASKGVCGGRHGGSTIMKSSRLQCYWETLSNSVDKIGNEDLTRIHAG